MRMYIKFSQCYFLLAAKCKFISAIWFWLLKTFAVFSPQKSVLDGSEANVVEAAVEGEVGEDEGGVGEEGGKGVREEGGKDRWQVDKCLGELKRNVLQIIRNHQLTYMTDKGSLHQEIHTNERKSK